MSVKGRKRPASGAMRLLPLPALVGLLVTLGAPAGQNPAPSAQNPPPAAPPAAVQEQAKQPTFKLQIERNLVVVRAVVRDSKGNALRGLHQDDFQIFDNGKPQAIAHFAVEGVEPKTETPKPSTSAPASEAAATSGPAESSAPSRRYLGLLFDDVHGRFEDLEHTREAADRYLASALQLDDRVGLFTVSGQGAVDFTDDMKKIHDALFRLRPRPIVAKSADECPEIFEYQAYQIVHENDSYSVDIATQEALTCHYNSDQRFLNQARQDAQSEAVRVLSYSEVEAEAGLRSLDEVVRRLGYLPGQRNVVLISPGFLTPTIKPHLDEIVERALRSNVIINTYDAKGLDASIPLGDATQRPMVVPRRADLVGRKVEIQLASITKAAEVLRDTAYDTGGVFFHNSNDFDGGFRQVSSLPEVYYVLAYSPTNIKYDGRFHSIKVSLVPPHLTLQARRGYYAPRTAPDDVARAEEDLEQAVYSQDQMNELPVEMHTQFFRASEQEAKLNVLTHLDLRFLSFKKREGRNQDNLVVVTALFDRDGKCLTATKKTLEFHLRDGTLERYARSGVTMKTSFDVKPGTYLVRQVVRDADGGQLSGLSRTVEISF